MWRIGIDKKGKKIGCILSMWRIRMNAICFLRTCVILTHLWDIGMKSVTYWYQFFTAREELVPILHDVKFTKCEICGSTELLIMLTVCYLCILSTICNCAILIIFHFVSRRRLWFWLHQFLIIAYLFDVAMVHKKIYNKRQIFFNMACLRLCVWSVSICHQYAVYIHLPCASLNEPLHLRFRPAHKCAIWADQRQRHPLTLFVYWRLRDVDQVATWRWARKCVLAIPKNLRYVWFNWKYPENQPS